MDATAQAILRSGTKRQYRTAEEKRRIVEETLKSGVSVATVARAWGINANQVFHWRKLYQAGLLGSTAVASASASGGRFLSVMIPEDRKCELPVTIAADRADHAADRGSSPGSIEVKWAEVQMRIAGQVDAGALRVVLECRLG